MMLVMNMFSVLSLRKRRTNNFVKALLTFLSNKMEGRTYTPYFIVAFVMSSFENKFYIPPHGCIPKKVKIIYTLGKHG